MADVIAPPSVSAPLTAADAAIIRAEKQLDEDTRGRLVQIYGESRTALGRHIAMRRQPWLAWRCPQCRQTSDDIRHVCGNCLAPEPRGGLGAAPENRVELRKGRTQDQWAATRVISETGRCYRQFTEPVAKLKAASRLTRTATVESGEGDAYEDEPECDDDGALCRPDPGEDDDDANFQGDGAAATTGTGGEHLGKDDGSGLPAASRLNKEKHLPPERGAPFTHFVSLPVGKLPAAAASAEAVLASLRAYAAATAEAEAGMKAAAGRSGHDSNGAASAVTHLSPELVSSAPQLHVTLLLLSLPTAEDVVFAKELLAIFAARWAAIGRPALARSTPVCVPAGGGAGLALRFGGLHVMPERGSGSRTQPKKAAVVYMGLADENTNRAVRTVQDLLHECFAELISEEHRAEVARTKTNLHMTLMNKKWRRHGAKRPFDATGILEKFGKAAVSGTEGEPDGPVVVPVIELNRLSNRDPKAETYTVEASVPL